jgi:periplasmic copper chaperone A
VDRTRQLGHARLVRELRRVLIGGVLLAGVICTPAWSHAVISPTSARPADPQVYTLTIPNEGESDTVDIRVRVPEGIDFLLLETPPAGWEGEIVRKGDAISELRWTGGAIAPEQFAQFRFIARNPVMEGEVTWPTVQRYEDGQVQRWIGEADDDEPAPRVTLSESATPVDVLAVSGEKIPEGPDSATSSGSAGTGQPEPATSGANESAAADEGTDTLSIVALVVGGLGLLLGGAAFAASRKRPQTA